MSTQELIKNDSIPSSTPSETSANLEPPKDVKRELADAEVNAIRGGQNGHNSPPTSSGTPTR